jgi:hypothetical protein
LHPGITVGATRFTLGLLAKGAGFDVFYNGGYVGSVVDDTLAAMGQVGIVASAEQTTPTRAQFDNLLMTVPFDEAAIIPQQVIPDDAIAMVQSLKRNHVVSPSGLLALTVPEVTVAYARPGIQRLMVGRGTTYENFVMGANVEFDALANRLTGCGLVFRFANETDYTLAYVDQLGGYGVSKRDGDTFAPGIFGDNPVWASTQHHLLIIADANTLYFYVDGRLAGVQENTPQTGEVGTAVVNFEGIDTSCRFTDLWLWRW